MRPRCEARQQAAPAVGVHPGGARSVWTSRQGLLWYLRRSRVMGPAELVHRVREQSRLAMLRAAYLLGWTAPSGARGAGRHEPCRLSFCAAAAGQFPDLAWSFEPNEAERTALLEGRLQTLGCSWVWRP